MSTIALTDGFYAAKSVIAAAQRAVNLYPERNPQSSPFPFTSYPRPGKTLFAATTALPVRCLYRASTGDLYEVNGTSVNYVDSAGTRHLLGSIASATSICSMADNRLVIILVDGTGAGYYIDLTNNRAFGTITAAAFYGSTRVDYLDTFFLFNEPGTANWYISASELNAALLVGGGVVAGTINGGTGYSNGRHLSVALSGGSGQGATADITVITNMVTGVAIDTGDGAFPYQVGDVLSATGTQLGGGITAQTFVGGIGYTAGTYAGVALSGGSGANATATIVVTGTTVASVTIVNPGHDFVAGDVLTASAALIGSTGTGFSVLVGSVNTAGTGFTYTVTAVNAGDLAFNALDIAAKSGASDTLAAVIAIHREAWLIGQLTSEVWYDAGTPDFAFGALPGVFMEHGTVAPYSIAKTDLQVFWLGRDHQGHGIVFMGAQYTAKRVSTHAIENVLQGYSTLADAIGYTFQIEGHAFYALSFPTADATWVYDLATELWHQWTWTDNNGVEHRDRGQVQAFAYGMNIVGDWQNGALYALDPTNPTDNGQPIIYRRGFPLIENEGKRLSCDRFIVEMDVGTAPNTMDSPEAFIAGLAAQTGVLEAVSPAGLLVQQLPAFSPPMVSFRWSNTKGSSWAYPLELSIGSSGEYGTSMQARQLGLGRYWVFEVFWSGAMITAINGAWADFTACET